MPGVPGWHRSRRFGKVASYGSLLDNEKRFCAKHKREGDANLASKMCEQCMAQKTPVRKVASYGSMVDNKKRFCAKHQREGDANLADVTGAAATSDLLDLSARTAVLNLVRYGRK